MSVNAPDDGQQISTHRGGTQAKRRHVIDYCGRPEHLGQECRTKKATATGQSILTWFNCNMVNFPGKDTDMYVQLIVVLAHGVYLEHLC